MLCLMVNLLYQILHWGSLRRNKSETINDQVPGATGELALSVRIQESEYDQGNVLSRQNVTEVTHKAIKSQAAVIKIIQKLL